MAGQKIHSAKRKRFITNSVVHVVLGILAVIWVFPVIWIVLTSFRAEQGSYVSTFLPQSYTLDNYIRLFTDTTILNFPQMFMNTLFIAVFSCILSTFYVLAVSYCLSRLRFKLRKPYMNMAMILGLFPGFMSMIAVYFILKAIGLTEGNLIKLALILVYKCCSAGAVLISIPSAALFLYMQRYYVDGLSGAVKGKCKDASGSARHEIIYGHRSWVLLPQHNIKSSRYEMDTIMCSSHIVAYK